MAVGLGAGQLFEEVGVLNGGGNFVVSAGPFTEVEQSAAVGAEGKVLVGGEDYFAAGGAEESFRHGLSILSPFGLRLLLGLRRWNAADRLRRAGRHRWWRTRAGWRGR